MRVFSICRIIAVAAVALASATGAKAQETVRYATDGYGMGALAIIASDKGFLKDEGIKVVGSSLGGMGARRVQFWPVTGRAQQRIVTDTHEVATLKEVPRKPAPPAEDEGSLELF